MKAKSIKGKSVEEIQIELAENKKDGFNPTLAFVFISNIDHAAALQSMFTKESINIFGASTDEA